MHRFRKKSDAKRSQVPDALRATPTQQHPHEPLPTLPPVSDFRTSLILPDLTRRFSVLRNSAGIPIGLDDLKSKFAEQRARGSQNQVSEEEEDMILEALGRFHARTARRAPSGAASDDSRENGNVASTYTASTEDHDVGSRISASPSFAGRQSLKSTTTTSSSVLHGSASAASLSSTKGSQTSRRMSNNLFGSGKFRDQTYVRSVNHRRTDGTRSSAVTHSESNSSMNTITSRAANNSSVYSDNHSLRPITPEGSTYSPTNSVPSSPNKAPDSGSDTVTETDGIGARLTRSLAPETLRRVSMALDAVIAEIEEEGDDEIVMERSPIIRAPSTTTRTFAEPESIPEPQAPSSGDYEAGTALSSDDQVVSAEAQRTSPYPRSRTTSPTPRLPGYIPGMPRPMTPHDTSLDSDDQTPSTTPRATSPRLPGVSASPPPILVQTLTSTMYRSNSTASTSRQSPRPISPASTATPTSSSPMFFSRTVNGRFTPEDRSRNGNSSPTPEVLDSPVLGRRRPISPLSGPAYQPLTSMAQPSSRPATPSNINWNFPSSPSSNRGHRSGSISGHSRNGSTVSFGVTSNGASNGHPDDLERSKSLTRSLRSPALPDSPWIDNGNNNVAASVSNAEYRPPSAMSSMDLGSPIQIANRSLRSPTPTHSNTYSPTSPTFPDSVSGANGTGFSPSRRSSRQNAHHSSFSLGPAHALLLSPIANSSRSSLESAGSSYHSWDEDQKKDRLVSLFNHIDAGHAEWHDVSVSIHDKSGSSTSATGTTPYEGTPESEEIVKRDLGLTKNDFVAIQDKLVTAALTKAATPESRNRVSSLRRRRPSTSQSNYSYNGGDSRVASPAPQLQSAPAMSASSPTPTPAPNSEHIAKVNALLDSVVDSIQSPRSTNANGTTTPGTPSFTAQSPETLQQSNSPLQRQRALADALFGVEDRNMPKTPTSTPSAVKPSLTPVIIEPDQPVQPIPTARVDSPLSRDMPTPKPNPPTRDLSPIISHSQSSSVPSSSHGHGQMDPAMLALDVQRRAEAATAALRKSPSNQRLADHSGSRKRISPNQISSPKLMSASTSVDTIPLRPPPITTAPAQHAHAPTKFGSRFKKLRGTLRSKTPIPTGEEITPYPVDVKTPPSAQSVTYTPSNLVPHGEPASAMELGRFKAPAIPVPSPPASAGPGLKGFMSRFRKHRTADVSSIDRRYQVSPGVSSSSSVSPQDKSFSPSPSPNIRSAPATVSNIPLNGVRPLSPQQPISHALKHEPVIPENLIASSANEGSSQNDELALKQLFDAANNLGLDQAALTDLIARSPSTSSRSVAWPRSGQSSVDTRKSHRASTRESAISRSPAPSEGRPSIDALVSHPSVEIKQLNIRKNTEQLNVRPRQDQSDVPRSAVVRRTIFVPSDSRVSTFDINALMRKHSASRRRRSAGAGSIQSNRSIHDRAPTPPPPRSSMSGRRFSTDTSHPMPQLPHSLAAHPDLPIPPSQMENSTSTYDSLYEMYAGDSKAGNMLSPDSQAVSGSQHTNEAIPASGPALEVVELANGETIWSIVNGLRDDDAESFYGDRASFTSEYSLKETEGIKLFFKEHGRKGSKGSNSSFLSRKKNQPPPSANRPDTKVFYSSPAQIGRIIENLSRGVDSGSFNIMPESTQGHSHVGHSTASSVGSETDMRWTVEEQRLQQMLGAMSPKS